METQHQPQTDSAIALRTYPPLENFRVNEALAVFRALIMAQGTDATLTINGKDNETSGVLDRRKVLKVEVQERGGTILAVAITTGPELGADAVSVTDSVTMPDLTGMLANAAAAVLQALVAEYAALNDGETFPVSYRDAIDHTPLFPPFSEDKVVQSTDPIANSPIDASGVVADIIIQTSGITQP